MGLLNGLGGQLLYDFREIFAQQVFQWLGESQPVNSQNYWYNQERDCIDCYFTKPNQEAVNIKGDLPLILTPLVAQILDVLRVWLKPNNEQHFLLIGPHGSAKMYGLSNAVS